MWCKIKSNDWLFGIIIGLCSFIGSVLLVLSELFTFDIETVKQMIAVNGPSVVYILVSSGVFTFVLTYFAWVIGSKFSRKLKIPTEFKMSKNKYILLGVVGIGIPIILTILDRFVYPRAIENFASVPFRLLDVLAGIVYNGFTEEIWFRFGLTSVLIYAIWYAIFKKMDKENTSAVIPDKCYLIGIVFVGLLLFLWQFNVVTSIYMLSIAVVIRVVLNYFVMSLIYGYSYWKNGLKFTILMHVLFILTYVGVIPLISLLFV